MNQAIKPVTLTLPFKSLGVLGF